MKLIAALLLVVGLGGCATDAAKNPGIAGIHGYPWPWMSDSDWSKVWLPGDTVKDLNDDPEGLSIGVLPADFTGTIYYTYGKSKRRERIKIERGEIKEVWFSER